MAWGSMMEGPRQAGGRRRACSGYLADAAVQTGAGASRGVGHLFRVCRWEGGCGCTLLGWRGAGWVMAWGHVADASLSRVHLGGAPGRSKRMDRMSVVRRAPTSCKHCEASAKRELE
eukprot:1711706-Prymnesium_polylepis.1